MRGAFAFGSRESASCVSRCRNRSCAKRQETKGARASRIAQERTEKRMSDRSPKSLWDRVRRRLEGWMDPDAEADEAELAFHLLFAAPVLLAFVILVRR
jgi:hypothetical protein